MAKDRVDREMVERQLKESRTKKEVRLFHNSLLFKTAVFALLIRVVCPERLVP